MSSGDHQKVSIIVVNWNGERFLKDCLGALSKQSYADCEIILVDNGSSDNSVCFTREQFPAVKVVALKENKGFTGGNAAGLEVAHGAFLALVNNDARPDQTWLENLIQPMLRDRCACQYTAGDDAAEWIGHSLVQLRAAAELTWMKLIRPALSHAPVAVFIALTSALYSLAEKPPFFELAMQ